MTMKYLSLFSGIGGFELGFPVDWGCVGYSETDKYAVEIYSQHFPNHKNYGDVTKIDASTLSDFELLCGGFPCQAFSIAGRRKGFVDTRGTLFFEIARIIREKQPRLLLLENVKGLLSHDQGRTFETILRTLDECGYDAEWQVLNSKNFGVPQNRERVFIIGHLRGSGGRKIFPIGEDKASIDDQHNKKVQESEIAQTITATYWKGGKGSQIMQINNPIHSNDRVYNTDGISPALNTMQGGNRQPFVLDDVSIRKLTPIECERLQGFPDGWTKYGQDGKEISDTQRYKCLGNAITVNVIKYISQYL